MALSLHRPRHRFFSNYTLLHFFSSSSNDHSNPQHHHEPQPNPNIEQLNLHTLKIRRVSPYVNSTNSNNTPSSLPPPAFDKLRESLRKMEARTTPDSIQNVTRPGIVGETSNVFGGFPFSKEGDNESSFCRHYTHDELGHKLRSLKPSSSSSTPAQKGWFLLHELNDRLKKLKELEREHHSTGGKLKTIEILNSFSMLKDDHDEKNARRAALQNLSLIGKISSSTTAIQLPPKEHLIEKYLHPDNMSAAEKMKIELAKVREEFKISESDCGSARVQVAQLTTKIKHLSAVLNKKDKHSRKGLEEMVQRRKKLLKYLRRTDWESYCFVISKLGLRDNPDYKESHKKRLKT